MDDLVPAYGSVTLHNGNTCYMVMRTGSNVMCLSSDGNLVWTRTLSGSSISNYMGCPITLGPDGTIYAATNELAALNPNSGLETFGDRIQSACCSQLGVLGYFRQTLCRVRG